MGCRGNIPSPVPPRLLPRRSCSERPQGLSACPGGHTAPGGHEAQPERCFASRQSMKWAEPAPGTAPRAGGSCVPGGVGLGWSPLAPYGCSRSDRDAAAGEQLVKGSVLSSAAGIAQIRPGPAPQCLSTAGVEGQVGLTDTESPGCFGVCLAHIFCAQALDARRSMPISCVSPSPW